MKAVGIAILVFLALSSEVLTHPLLDEQKRWIPRLHTWYLMGLHQGINDAGGISPRDWHTVNLMTQTQQAARADLSAMVKEILNRGEDIDADWAIRTYADLLKKRGLSCNHPLWTDTGTRDFCLGLK